MASSTARLDWVVGGLDLRPDHQVVEIGGGHGVAATAVLGALGPDGRYVGIDRSAAMADAAARRNADPVAAGRARFVVDDLLAAGIAAGTQDRVFACRVAALADPEPLRAALAWLAPGGTLTLAFDDPVAERTALLVERAEAAATDAGARVAATHRLGLDTGEVVALVLTR